MMAYVLPVLKNGLFALLNVDFPYLCHRGSVRKLRVRTV